MADRASVRATSFVEDTAALNICLQGLLERCHVLFAELLFFKEASAGIVQMGKGQCWDAEPLVQRCVSFRYFNVYKANIGKLRCHAVEMSGNSLASLRIEVRDVVVYILRIRTLQYEA